MPIQYRCSGCDQLLSISTRKAGLEVPCPMCGHVSIVPVPDTDSSTESNSRTESNQAETLDLAGDGSDQDQFLDSSDSEPVDDSSPHRDNIERDELQDADLDESSSNPLRHLENPIQELADETLETQSSPESDAGGIQLRRASPSLGELDLTSMVDVTFLLLIFFMVTASFSLQKTIELPTPNPDQKGAAQSLTLEDLQANTIFVKVDETNQIFVDDIPAGDPQRLETVLTQARLTTLRTEVAIDAHPEALHETVVHIIDAATAAGMQKVRIVSRVGAEE